MADGSNVIVDFSALEEAITAYTTNGGQIETCATDLQSNASAIAAAWKSNASNTYQQKMQNLIRNFNAAKEALDTQIADLRASLEKERGAEQKAGSIAESVNDFVMK